ncbi:MAG TPA: hypothetical protein VHI13_15770 [Candidatus Kapabacteria bacterium]|nr:hypothetical protein [Candidatus Kapabacteria bacterium]
MRILRSVLLLPPLALATLLGSCADSTLGTGIGSGTVLEATLNGTVISFDLTDVAGYNTYTIASKETRFGGTSGKTTLTMRLDYDIDQGTFPHTLTGGDISIVYIESSGSTPLTYDCAIGSDCSVTVTNSNGSIVDGTFHAQLTERSDTTKKISVTGGTFSVTVARQ